MPTYPRPKPVERLPRPAPTIGQPGYVVGKPYAPGEAPGLGVPTRPGEAFGWGSAGAIARNAGGNVDFTNRLPGQEGIESMVSRPGVEGLVANRPPPEAFAGALGRPPPARPGYLAGAADQPIAATLNARQRAVLQNPNAFAPAERVSAQQALAQARESERAQLKTSTAKTEAERVARLDPVDRMIENVIKTGDAKAMASVTGAMMEQKTAQLKAVQEDAFNRHKVAVESGDAQAKIAAEKEIAANVVTGGMMELVAKGETPFTPEGEPNPAFQAALRGKLDEIKTKGQLDVAREGQQMVGNITKAIVEKGGVTDVDQIIKTYGMVSQAMGADEGPQVGPKPAGAPVNPANVANGGGEAKPAREPGSSEAASDGIVTKEEYNGAVALKNSPGYAKMTPDEQFEVDDAIRFWESQHRRKPPTV